MSAGKNALADRRQLNERLKVKEFVVSSNEAVLAGRKPRRMQAEGTSPLYIVVQVVADHQRT